MKYVLLIVLFVTFAGSAVALEPDQLTATEQQTYERVKNDPQAAQRFSRPASFTGSANRSSKSA